MGELTRLSSKMSKGRWRLVLVLAVVWLLSRMPGQTTHGQVDLTGPRVTMVAHFGCRTPEIYRDLAMMQWEDQVAFRTGLGLALASDACAVFEKGERVHVMDVSILTGLARVRPNGSVQSFWTRMSLLEDPTL